jgi:ADP-dependent NAD(P)H-hydrate dehydratase / NAD(P)H-hydrate epimerase
LVTIQFAVWDLRFTICRTASSLAENFHRKPIKIAMPVPIINVAQMREWEKATWAAGQTEAEVIRRVGEKVAEVALRMTRVGDGILILAGKGHNGNDARAARQHLRDRHLETLDVTAPEKDLAKLKVALRSRPALVIDGLFGIGLNRPLDNAWKNFISAVNDSKIPVLAVDVPSGLNVETGEPEGAAIEVAVTLTVGAPKMGMLQESAWQFVGRLEVAEDVGLVTCPHQRELNWMLPGDFADFPPRRSVAGHKGSFGHLAIIAGSFGFQGAAVLAARGAQRAQPGLITAFPQESVFQPVASQLQAVMVNAWKARAKLPEKTSAILIGPGLAGVKSAKELTTAVRRLWRPATSGKSVPVIVDATALDWLALGALPKNEIRVVTPHPGEAARMLGKTTQQIQANRLQAVREISRRFGNCWVVLKGHQTLVGRSEGKMFVNSSGNPHLAQGGSGDVLSGFIAGLLAQPALQTDVGKTLRYAVWQHGVAADRLQAVKKNWVVEDLVAELGKS